MKGETNEKIHGSAVTNMTNNRTVTYSLSLTGVPSGSSIVAKLYFVVSSALANTGDTAEYSQNISLPIVSHFNDNVNSTSVKCMQAFTPISVTFSDNEHDARVNLADGNRKGG